MPTRFRLTLYVTPDNSGKALADLYAALQVIAYTDYELEIVNALAEPKRAKQAKIEDTPKLIQHSPNGDKIIGELSNHKKLRNLLGI